MTMATDKLPADVLRQLDAISKGRGRTASAAHPDCNCLRRMDEERARLGGPISYGHAEKIVSECPVHERAL